MMEWPLAIAIAMPASSFIIMGGGIILRSMNNKGSPRQGEINRKELDNILEKKLDGIVYIDTCNATQRRIEQKIDLLVDHLTDKMETVEEHICNQMKMVEKELRNRKT